MSRIVLIFVLLLVSSLGIMFHLSRDEVIDYTTSQVKLPIENIPEKDSSTEKETLTLGHVADGIYAFLLSTYEKDNEVYLSKKCTGNNCSVETEAHLPGRAWYLLSHARAATLKNVPLHIGEVHFEDAEKRIKKVFGDWTALADRKSEVYSLHQLFSAYRVYEDPVILRWFYSRIPFLENYVKLNILPTGKLKKLEPYLAMALARQFANGAAINFDPDLGKIVHGKSVADPEIKTTGDSFVQLSEILINSFSRNSNPAVVEERLLFDDIPPGSDAMELEKISQFACFEKWAEVSLLEAYQKNKGYESKAEKLEKRLLDFFSMMYDLERAGNTFNFSTLQSVLACVHAISDFKSTSDGFPEHLDIRGSLLLKYVILQGDPDEASGCQGDGGFFSTFEIKNDIGCQREKSMVDNSWLYFLVDEQLRVVEIAD